MTWNATDLQATYLTPRSFVRKNDLFHIFDRQQKTNLKINVLEFFSWLYPVSPQQVYILNSKTTAPYRARDRDLTPPQTLLTALTERIKLKLP